MELKEDVPVRQEAQMRTGPANVSVRTALETANVITKPENVVAKLSLRL